MTDTKQAVKALREAMCIDDGGLTGIAPAAALVLAQEAKRLLPPILDRLEELENPWRPMSEAPRDGTEVLLLFSDGVRAIGSWSVAAEFWDNHYCETDEEPGDASADEVWITHWMPLPPIPTKDGDNG